MKYLYGPVPSRRLGRSLGIDPFETKTCTHNCVYCQLGSAPTVSSAEWVEGVPAEAVKAELEEFFSAGGSADFVTFSGSGEPTLWAHTGEIIGFIRKKFPHLKIAVITNSSTLWRPEVREAIMPADVVVPTVAAADETVYLKLHRPHHDADFARYVEGIKEFARQFRGEIWAEVMLVAGVNDGEGHILKLRALLDEISPTYIDLNTPVRPPSEGWVRPPSEAAVRKICALLGSKCRIVGKFHREGTESVAELAELATRILELLRRRPEQPESIAESFGIPVEKVNEALEALVAKKLAVKLPSGFFKLAHND